MTDEEQERPKSMTDTISHSPRIRALRDAMIKAIPRVPNNRKSLEYIQRLPTSSLVLVYLCWRLRVVPAKPRKVKAWPGGLDPFRFLEVRNKLLPLLRKVEAGEDLTPHLSDLVRTAGFSVPDPNKATQGYEDLVLARLGLHHFHVGEVKAGNPKGRSGQLVFADVTEAEFTIVAYMDHDVFKTSSPGFRKFLGICDSYIQKDMAPGTAYMNIPVTVSGHPSDLVDHAVACFRQIQSMDPQLDDPEFVSKFLSEFDFDRPNKVTLKWHFEDLNFGLLETKTGTFFNIYSYYAR